MTRPNRNELCPCGSGKKNKKCCGAVENRSLSRGVLLSLAPVALLAGLGIYAAISGSGESTPAAAAPATAPATAPVATPVAARTNAPAAVPAGSKQPISQPGAAPAGKVWSPEHGHWHGATGASGRPPVQIDLNMANPAVKADAGGIRIDGKALAAAAGEMRFPGQPDGPAPPGKVWSTQHKHWHDKPAAPPMETIHLGTVNRPKEPVAQPGPAPAGKVWSPEHGHWHDTAPAPVGPLKTGTQPQ